MTQKKISQKKIFLESEADAWFDRNHEALSSRRYEDDVLSAAVIEIASMPSIEGKVPSILEIGCGEGKRLAWLASQLDVKVAGIEPSAKAVVEARSIGIDARQGTADALPWQDASFDIVVFGFCLYLCDPEDFFRIAAEADRVLKPNAWLLIQDFHANSLHRRTYHHRSGIYSTKMDYRRLFDWHPAYTCYSHKITAHGLHSFTDDAQEWVGTSVLRKQALE